ncbi:hypothetical protein AX16_005309 [Volvariella volvacea WC 439]|nr:hypothetical protein AX16_005309 [Volvariella volvacea WC 439]
MHDAVAQQNTSLVTQLSAQLTILREFEKWSSHVDRHKNMIWLNGPSGSGKTTICRSLIHYFYDGKHSELAGAFFFDKHDEARNSGRAFAVTVAYQLAMWNEAVREKILEALKFNPAILTARLDWQWLKLVVEPIRAVSSERIPPAIVIIDALCQCNGPVDQGQILSLVSSDEPNSPLFFLITSSLGPRIITAFSTARISNACRRQIELDPIAPSDVKGGKDQLQEDVDNRPGQSSTRESGLSEENAVRESATKELTSEGLSQEEPVRDPAEVPGNLTLLRRRWTPREDQLLCNAVEKEDPGNPAPSKWHAIAKHVPNRTVKDCKKRWFAKMASDVVKGGWAPDEDERLVQGVERYGTRWSLVASVVQTRNSDQCAKRWADTLNPAINRTSWTPEADELLIQAVNQHGKVWTKIVKTYFPGRTGLSAKNRYNSITRFGTENLRQRGRRVIPESTPYPLHGSSRSDASPFSSRGSSPASSARVSVPTMDHDVYPPGGPMTWSRSASSDVEIDYTPHRGGSRDRNHNAMSEPSTPPLSSPFLSYSSSINPFLATTERQQRRSRSVPCEGAPADQQWDDMLLFPTSVSYSESRLINPETFGHGFGHLNLNTTSDFGIFGPPPEFPSQDESTWVVDTGHEFIPPWQILGQLNPPSS